MRWLVSASVILLLTAMTSRSFGGCREDFRNHGFNHELFRLDGSEFGQFIKPEPEGLRLSATANRHAKGPVGIVFRPKIIGSFIIDVTFELLTYAVPDADIDSGFNVYFMTDSPPRDAFSLVVQRYKGGDGMLSVRHLITESGGGSRQKAHKHVPLPAFDGPGRILLNRQGSLVSVYYSAGAANLSSAHVMDVPTESVSFLRVGADPGIGLESVSVRLLEFRCESTAMTKNEVGPQDTHGTQDAQESGLFVVAIVLVGLLVGVILFLFLKVKMKARRA